MHVFGQTCELEQARSADEFDRWLRLKRLSKGFGFYVPIKLHRRKSR